MPAHIKDWFLIYMSKGNRDDDDAGFLVQKLQNSASKLGIKVENPYYITMNDDYAQSWLK